MASQPVYDFAETAAPIVAPRVQLALVPAADAEPAVHEPLHWGLHPRLYKLMATFLFGYLTILGVGFAAGAGMPLVLAISAVTFAACLGLPWAMAATPTGAPDRLQSWRRFMREGIGSPTAAPAVARPSC